MDKQEVSKRDGKARKTFNVDKQQLYLDTDYNIVVLENNEISPTGLLIIAELRPIQNKKLPRFVFRWDQKANTLDVDALNAKKEDIDKFKNGTSNFSGHHPTKLTVEGRQYEVRIVWAGKILFQGHIGFSLAREVVFSVALGVNASFNIK